MPLDFMPRDTKEQITTAAAVKGHLLQWLLAGLLYFTMVIQRILVLIAGPIVIACLPVVTRAIQSLNADCSYWLLWTQGSSNHRRHKPRPLTPSDLITEPSRSKYLPLSINTNSSPCQNQFSRPNLHANSFSSIAHKCPFRPQHQCPIEGDANAVTPCMNPAAPR